MNIDIVLCRATWMKFGTFTPENVNSGGSVILARNGILGFGTTVEHEEIFLGRDHLVRIRQLDWSCTVINLHDQPEHLAGTPWTTSCSYGDASRAAALLAAFSRSVEIAQPFFHSSRRSA